MNTHIKYLVCLSALILAGCANNGSNIAAIHSVQFPEQWQQATDNPLITSEMSIRSVESVQIVGISPWWEAFGDVQLNRLVQLALARNNNIAAAGFKLKQAQLQIGLAQNDQLPNFSGSGSASGSQRLASGTSSHSVGLGASVRYEVDLWGKLARATEQKQWEAQATAQDLRSTQLSIAASVARLYWQIAYLNQKQAISQASMAHSQQTLAFVKVQLDAGAASQLDVFNAEKTLSSQKAAMTDVINQREQARNALAILFDTAPTQRISPEPQALPIGDLPSVSMGIPAQILAQRPDLAASELRLRSTMANIDIARANFYPSLSLTGSVNGSSSSLSKLLTDPVGALALNLALPFLNWHENQLNLKVSKNTYEQAVVDFRQTLYSAMAEVENALSEREKSAQKVAQLKQQLSLSQKTEKLYEIRYRAGAASLKEWLNAQDDVRQAQASVLAEQYTALTNQVTLYLALGASR